MKSSTMLGFLSMLRWWWLETRLPFGTQPFQVLLDCGIQCVILSCPSSASEYEVHLCLGFVEGWQEHLLMIYNLVVDTVVLFVHWNQRPVVAVSKVLDDWCQSWRCSRGTRPTPLSNQRQLRSSEYFIVLPLVQFCGVFVFFQCPSSFIHGFLMIHLPLVVSALSPSWQDYCGTVERSFQRCKNCSDSVHRTLIGPRPDAAKTHVQSLWYVLQERRTLNSRRGLSQFDQLHVAHLVNSATWFFTEVRIPVRQIVTNGFCALSNS